LSISKDPPNNNSSINLHRNSSKDFNQNLSKENLLVRAESTDIIPESQASLQNTKPIDLSGINVNLQNFQKIKDQMSKDTGSDFDEEAPVIDRDEEVKSTNIDYSQLFSKLTSPQVEIADNMSTSHNQRFFEIEDSTR